jgi:hypothetical protein
VTTLEDKKKTADLDRRLKEAISSIPEVISARIILDDQDEVIEIQVKTNEKEDLELLRRRIITNLREELGLEIDGGKIFLEKEIVERKVPTRVPLQERVVLTGVDLSIYGNMIRVRVKLKKNSNEAIGVSEGPNTSYNQLKIVAEATVKSVENLISEQNIYYVDSVLITNMGENRVVSVLLYGYDFKNEKTLVGSSIIKNNIQQSVVFATLDALNRILSLHLNK